MSVAFSAIMKRIAWRCASFLPKVSRFLAYSTASSWARRAKPTQLIATEIRLGVKKPPSATSRPSPSLPRRLATGTGARSKTKRSVIGSTHPHPDSSIATTVAPGAWRSTSNATVPSAPRVPATRAKSSQ